MENLELLKKLQELGISFSASVPAPYGTQTFVCAPSDMLELIEDSTAFHAKCYEVTTSQYLQCVEESFNLRCAGLTAKGKRCKNIVDDGTGIFPKEWVSRQGEYCHVHSGENHDL
jgi:hypothetical protein